MPSWIAALKTYNSRQPAWCIPRKGTDEYNKVRKIMSGEKTKKPKILKQVDSFKKQDDIYEEPRNIQRTPTAKITTRKVGMTDVPQDVMNLMGNYLGTKEKAKFNQVNKNVKVDYGKKDYLDRLKEAVRNRILNGEGGERFVETLESYNSDAELPPVEKKINAYWKKYKKETEKYYKKIIKHIKSLDLSDNVEKHLINYFTGWNDGDDLRQYEIEISMDSPYEDDFKEYWFYDEDNEQVKIKKRALSVITYDMKILPEYIKLRYEEIIKNISLYKTIIGNKIIKLPYDLN
jgi:tRNA-dihydrouridine synthase